MKKYASVKISYILTAFFFGALVFFLSSIFGAVHAVSSAAAKAEARPTIILDAGHGGEDGGAVGVNGVEEKTVNLAVALHVQEALQSAGYPVVMIRDTDTAVGDTTLSTLSERKRSDIQYRTQLVNETENCILVSIHQNFFEQSQYSGAQMFYSPNNTRRSRRSDPSCGRRADSAGKHTREQTGGKRDLYFKPRGCTGRHRGMRIYFEP